uniref:Caspase family p10 domain-containing protein n=1 Tax=Callithrix jacchus TaxID=9483 RepID=A0A8I3WVQ5_CALJA
MFPFPYKTEDSSKKENFNHVEALFKCMLQNRLNNLVNKRVLKLKEKEKKKDYNTKIEGKALVLTGYLLKNYVAGQTPIQTLPDMDKKSTNIKANCGDLWVSGSPASLAVTSSPSPENLKADSVCKIHMEKDLIAFCSSTPNNASWRDSIRGPIFTMELITCFQKYSWCCHLVEVFQKVQKSFEIPRVKAQMLTIEQLSMTRAFYLFPGH